MNTKQLIIQYIFLRDELMDFTMEHFDAMSYDINGHLYYDEIDIEVLKTQVKAFKIMLKAYKLINYTYC